MERIFVCASLVFVLVACGSTMDPDDPQYEEPPTFLREEIHERISNIPYLTDEKLYDNLRRLVYIGEPAIPQLLDGLETGNARTRGSCAYVLGLIRDRRTIPPLKEALEDPVPSVRYEAEHASGALR